MMSLCCSKPSNGDADHVFGFDGAYNALASGRMLRYFVNTPLCVQESGPIDPELATPFGNTVDAYRMFNDRRLSPVPYLMIYDTKLTWNNTGSNVRKQN
ncbi:hypothetical protein CHS0354_024551 [Potamilus streckersoni]|uniref:Uncharacterized protein n=1 Tax=Potamilus streckersoni TaxID=2493646 RepID=A0AAE0TLH0_9BIVA|nr:hypothetical protein CHS0354_024551 [Potamilus streckersoni]